MKAQQITGDVIRRLILSATLTCGVLNTGVSLANAQEDHSIYGTYSVVFQPSQAGGELEGCTLVYHAVQADYAYLNGNSVAIVGNIGVFQFGANLILNFKVGVKDLVGNHSFVRPNFAYLQTKSYSTAKAKQTSRAGGDGFSLYVYSLYDSSVMNLLGEMMDSRKVTIGFNRKTDGLDILAPLDLDVIDAEYSGEDKVVRKWSNETLANFTNCLSKLVKQGEQRFNEK